MQKNNDDSCLGTYNRVQEGKTTVQRFIWEDSEKALEITLKIINLQCEIKIKESSDLDAVQECLGAVTAIYFFNNEYQDEIVLAHISTASTDVFSSIFDAFRFEWYYNRPNPEKWIAAIKALPDDKISAVTKEQIIEDLQTSLDDIEEFGVMF